ncbi:MAG: 3'-5' exonuclease [Candidatus Methylomirabilia bacterium]
MASLAERFRGLLKAGAIVDPGLPLEKIPFVVLDTELTGLDMKRDSVISVGAVKMAGTRIELGRSFYRLVSPRADFKREGIMVHGITPDDVVAQPPLGLVADELLAFCGDRIVAGHFLSLDLGFLGREAPAVKAADLRRRAVDTYRIHSWIEQQRHRHAGGYTVPEGSLNLVALALSHGIRVDGAHNALADAFITAQLLQRQLRALPALGVRTLGDLLRIGKP